jgi:hypothetical protein
MMEGAQKLYRSQSVTPETKARRSHRAPTNLPFFQWVGYEWKDEAPVYPSIHDCLVRFQDVIRADLLDINEVWKIYLPIVLSSDHHSWFEVHLEDQGHQPWSFAKSALIRDFAVQDAERLSNLTDELMAIWCCPLVCQRWQAIR